MKHYITKWFLPIILALLYSWPIMVLWNSFVPVVSNGLFTALNFSQAMAIAFLWMCFAQISSAVPKVEYKN